MLSDELGTVSFAELTIKNWVLRAKHFTIKSHGGFSANSKWRGVCCVFGSNTNSGC